MTTLECAETQERAAEFALGVLHGPERAEVIGHLEHCQVCAAQVADFARVVDGLTLIVPEAEPPVGFEEHVLRSIRVNRRPVVNRRRTVLALIALVSVIAAASIGMVRLVDGLRAPVEPPRAANLRANGAVVGKAVVLNGSDPWVMVAISGLEDGMYRSNVVDLAGDNVLVGEFSVVNGRGSWLVQAATRDVTSVRILNSDGVEIARADLPIQ